MSRTRGNNDTYAGRASQRGASVIGMTEDEKPMERPLTAIWISLPFYIQEEIEMDKPNEKLCEILSIDGCKVIMRFAPCQNPGAMDKVKTTLFHSKHTPQTSPKICKAPGILVL